MKQRPTRSAWVCFAALLLLFLLLLWRSPYGFDWSDEAYQSVVPYRLLQGDRPFIDTWEVHQLSGMIALPFLSVFSAFSGGSMEGVLLFFRYVALAIQLCVALYAFFTLRRRHGDVPAALAAGLILMHSHYAMNNFFYNTMTLEFLLLSAFLLFDAGERIGGARAWLSLASGAAYALAVLAYPYILLTLPVWLAYWFIGTRVDAARRRRGRMGMWLLGIVCIAAAFAAFVLSRCPLDALAKNLSGILGDPDHQSESLVHVLGYYFNAIRVLYGPTAYAAAALCVYAAGTLFVKNATRQEKLRGIGLWAAVALIAAEVAWLIPYDYPDYHKINLAAMGIAMTAPALYLLSGRRKDRSLLLFALGCALSIAVQIGSNTRVRASLGMLLPASVAALLYLFDTLRALRAGGMRRALTICAAAACAAMLALTAALRLTSVYRDERIPLLTATIDAGPAKGLRTTPKSAEQYAELCAAVTNNAPKAGTILVTNLMPIAYLLTDLAPAAPSCYNMTMDEPWLWKYYELHPERRPTYIFAAAKEYGVSNDLSLQGAAYAAQWGAYEIRELPAGIAFID